MREARVSALIVAKNEAETLPGCLATLDWANEVIVVVDAGSNDATEAIARERAHRVVVRPFTDFASQRNAALTLATGDWIFAIDADERASARLASEIRATISSPHNPHAGYRVPIRSSVLGRPFRFSGTQDDKPLRLFRRGEGRWTGEVHETVDLRGTIGTLGNSLRHRTIPDMKTFLRKINSYTTLESSRLYREGERPRRGDLWLRPIWTFLKLYLAKQGFRDGPEGFAFCALSGVSLGVRQWKLRELVRANSGATKLRSPQSSSRSSRARRMR